MTAPQYAAEWQKSATAFLKDGYYSWMDSQLGSVINILEVGCGSGASTLALAKPDTNVLSIESNQECIASAKSFLVGHGVDVEIIKLSDCANLFPWSGAKVKILHEDIFSSNIANALQQGGFDAIVCWLIGSHPGHISKNTGKPLSKFDGNETAQYRLNIHKRCYELGEKILSSSGLVHVVDRAFIRSTNDANFMSVQLAHHHSQLAGSSYAVSAADCKLKELPSLNQSNIQYVTQPIASNGVSVFISSLAKKK